MNEKSIETPASIDGLALALVTASSVPVLLLDGDLTVIAASDSFCSTFHIAPDRVPERQLSELGRGEWDNPQVRALLRATMLGYARVGAYEMELKRRDREPRRLVLNAIKLDTGDPEVVRILFSVTDITSALAAEALRQKLAVEKAALQQQMQHRIANSLQLVASVLLQAGRDLRWGSQPGGAYPALAMAEVEKRLGGTGEAEVEISAYLRQLCDSLEAALIENPERITLAVEAEYGMRCADDATALGLIVTELVINALRHAFPEHRRGTIRVAYRGAADGWTLEVSDDGSGMRHPQARRGLGTSVVEALARQLGADEVSVSGEGGTTVTLTRRLEQPTRLRVATGAHPA
jgi:two-component sensor histidine kinase